MITASDVAGVLDKASSLSGRGKFQACCPAHHDKTPSLSITDDGEKLLLHCHAGCKYEDVVAAIERKGVQLRQEFTPQPLKMKPVQPKTYDYLDETGAVSYQVIRQYKDGKKTFKQQRIENDKIIRSMDGVVRLPYNLPGILDAQKVVVVEGEKDVDRLTALGIAATCNSGGAGNWLSELNKWLKSKQVFIVPDNDEPGRKHAKDVEVELSDIADVKIVDLCEGMPEKADISDWLDRNKANTLWDALNNGQTAYGHKLIAYSIAELIAIEPKAFLIKHWLDRSAMSVVYGESGAGKTFFALDMCFHIAIGREWSGNRVHQGPVVYIAAEGGHGIRKRLEALLKFHGLKSEDVPLFVIPTAVDLCSADPDTAEIIAICKEHNAEIIVVDTLSRALAGGDENGPKDMGAFVVHCDRVRQAVDAHMMVIHHSGKDTAKGARGHSSLRAATDTEIELVKNNFTGTVTATTKKQREQEEGQIFSYILNSVELGEDADGDPVTSCVVEAVEGEARATEKLSTKQFNAKKAFYNALGPGKDCLSGTEWKDLMLNKGITESRTSAYGIRAALDAKGVIRIHNQMIYPVVESVRF
jgi:5S rRNA maturation endonuclease (ribonuclease M5)